ncbi:hypothetical protein GGR50DRAFT_196790 [Xylaria sp. CBS 124048]|nr:hypothetical protein GGR50DRAFT_196790 [Xylaria sp. CBS 124048]
MGVKFFVGWALWEQLTFVLAAGIVSVFIIGWIKLWWSQRLLKKYALLDEEKRLRQSELRKSGLPAGRRVDIPFGVRAIQSGVEVEGIWISRPVSPVEARTPSKASSTASDMENEQPRQTEDKGKGVQVQRPNQNSEAERLVGLPRFSPTVSTFDQNVRQDMSMRRTPGPSVYTPQRSAANNESLYATRSLTSTPQPTEENKMAGGSGNTRPQHIDIYVPTASVSSMGSPRGKAVAVDRMSVSSEEGLNNTPRHPVDIRGKKHPSYYRVPTEEPLSVAGPSTPVSAVRGKYTSRIRAEARSNPYESLESAAAATTTISSQPRRQSPPPVNHRFSLASSRPVPVRIYSDQREPIQNTSSRVVNSGFEVLPAGTFGRANTGGSGSGSGSGREGGNEGLPGIAR